MIDLDDTLKDSCGSVAKIPLFGGFQDLVERVKSLSNQELYLDALMYNGKKMTWDTELSAQLHA